MKAEEALKAEKALKAKKVSKALKILGAEAVRVEEAEKKHVIVMPRVGMESFDIWRVEQCLEITHSVKNAHKLVYNQLTATLMIEGLSPLQTYTINTLIDIADIIR